MVPSVEDQERTVASSLGAAMRSVMQVAVVTSVVRHAHTSDEEPGDYVAAVVATLVCPFVLELSEPVCFDGRPLGRSLEPQTACWSQRQPRTRMLFLQHRLRASCSGFVGAVIARWTFACMQRRQEAASGATETRRVSRTRAFSQPGAEQSPGSRPRTRGRRSHARRRSWDAASSATSTC